MGMYVFMDTLVIIGYRLVMIFMEKFLVTTWGIILLYTVMEIMWMLE